MHRPYFKKRIHELEQIYTDLGGDREGLRKLLDELKHRSTPRAVELRKKVDGDLSRFKASPQVKAHPERISNNSLDRKPPSRSKATEEKTLPPRVRNPEVSKSPSSSASPPGHDLEAPRTPIFSARDSASSVDEPSLQVPDTDALLAAWTTLEVLEPQPLPKPRDLTAIRRKMVRVEESSEPWEDERFARRGRESGVFWFVYLGEIELTAAYASILDLFPDESPEGPPKTKGTAPMAAVVLDEDGRPVEDRFLLSSFAWGYGKVRSRELRALADFPERERRVCRELEKHLIERDEEGEVLATTVDSLRNVTAWLRKRLRLPAEEVTTEPVYVRVPAWGRIWEAPEPELLNSFYLEDLARVRAAAKSADLGSAMTSFLTGKASRSRADVVRDPAALEEALAPERIPLARWPVRGRYPLVMMQQAAVNHVARELEDSGLVGVNGPPGTGKTTLLRDVVAKVVLDRSLAMAEFKDPQEAFSHVAPISAGRGFLHLYELDESLLGHEIVVASSNNKAVENISREIPARSAVADDFEPQLQYFAGIAESVFGSSEDSEGSEGAWGMAAAVLGNATNRTRFSRDFWWDKERGMHVYLRGIVDGWTPELPDDEEEDDEDVPPEILFLEGAPQNQAEALRRWRKAREQFYVALAHAETHRDKLQEIRRQLHDRAALQEALEKLSETIPQILRKSEAVERKAEKAEQVLSSLERKQDGVVDERDAYRALRPGFFARLFHTQAYRQWREEMAKRLAQVEQVRSEMSTAENELGDIRQSLAELEDELKRTKQKEAALSAKIEEIDAHLASARALLGERLPDRYFWNLPEEERQKLSPWLDETFQGMRDDLFAACFALHRAFIDAAAPKLRHNLGAAMILLKGRKLSKNQEPARRSLWASLFLAVPVMSTTFASVSRMFGPLGREQIGWLLVDEAGQAVPQHAVGAIWRSQRVVGIGDPMQIPPVVTMPQRLIDAILNDFDVEPDAWSAPRTSVQSLSDRASWFGTTLRQADGDMWVGSPLRVHRRCQEPMFSISNQIAYDGLMVQATPPGDSRIGNVLGPSRWLHVDDAQPGHWSEAEGEMAAQLLIRILEAGSSDPDIFFITPFRHVQDRLREKLRPIIQARTTLHAWSWVQDRVGTIHVVQGKEAEGVVLVLGAPSPQNEGSRRWAGSEPNLLNVAASRAKRRLYVVGNRQAWRKAGCFRTLAAHVPKTIADAFS